MGKKSIKPKAVSLRKINIINKYPLRLSREKKRRYNLLVSDITQGNITTGPRHIKRIMREHYGQYYRHIKRIMREYYEQ